MVVFDVFVADLRVDDDCDWVKSLAARSQVELTIRSRGTLDQFGL
jgi:hypothetical protein